MSALTDDVARRVIPRWRPFRVTAALGELGSAPPPPPHQGVTLATPRLDRLAVDWQEHHSLSFAADLVGAALVRGMPSRAREAADFILELGDEAPVSARALARAALGRGHGEADAPPESQSRLTLDASIGRLRAKLQEGPRNPVLWVDLARAYTLRGQARPATKAMRVALGQAPGNRFVLRSAARFFVHTGDSETAHDILRSADATRHDPWLLAAEIAVASAANRTPRFVREGAHEVVRAAAGPLDTSELATALGTLELSAGKTRRARRLFQAALTLPTDNALAQTQWASRQHLGLALAANVFDRPRSFEARALDLRTKGEWEAALARSQEWLYDEPFSRRAAAFASYVAGVPLEQYDECIRLATLGLEASPRDPLLLNNLAFALASSGRVHEAGQVFSRVPPEGFEAAVRPALLATRGLLQYRTGDLEAGRVHYEQAIEEARARNSRLQVALALFYHAREATLAASPHARRIWKEAQAEMEKVSEPERFPLRKRLEAVSPT